MKKIMFIITSLLCWQITFAHIHNNKNILTNVRTNWKDSTQEQIQINVSFPAIKPGDTVLLRYYTDLMGPNPHEGLDSCVEFKSIAQADGICHFKFTPLKKYGYVALFINDRIDPAKMIKHYENVDGRGLFKTDKLLDPLLTETGDNITLNIIRPDTLKPITPMFLDYKFSGYSSAKYNAILETDSVSKILNNYHSAIGTDLQFHPLNLCDYRIERAMKYLASRKNIMDNGFYQRLRIDLFYGTWKKIRNNAIGSLYKSLSKNDTSSLNKFRNAYSKLLLTDTVTANATILASSKEYVDFLRKEEVMRDKIEYGQTNLLRVYKHIKNNYSGALREKLMTSFFQQLAGIATTENYNDILEDALRVVHSPYYLSLLKRITHNTTGSMAYNFALPDVNGNIVHLSDFKGKVVFIDFFYTGCSNCLEFYENELSVVEQHFKLNPDIVFVGVSIDKTKALWLNSIKSGFYTSPDIFNLYTNGRGVNDPVISYYNVIGYPHPMIIDKRGRLYMDNDEKLRHKSSLVQILSALTKQ